MLNASSRLIRTPPPSFFLSSSSSSSSFPSQIGRKSTGGVRFHSDHAAAATPVNGDKMDNTNKNNPKTKEKEEEEEEEEEEMDVMADSFGVEYATRSNEEGFGGVYGGNQSLHDEEEEDDIEINRHGNPPEHRDKSHGSTEVK